MEKKKFVIEGQKIKRITGLLHNAYQDYLSARILFMSNMLTAACCMANQALEKQLKAIIEVDPNSKEYGNHNSLALLNIFLRIKPEFESKLNKSYFKALTKIYDTRYYENLPDGFKYEILKNKFLAELDYCYSTLYPVLEISQGEKSGRSQYDIDIEKKNPILYLNNYVLAQIEKGTFLRQPENTEQFLMVGNSFIKFPQEISYSVDNGKFSYSGIKIIDEKSFKHTDWLNEEAKYQRIVD